jgi:hypothetical protein
MKSCNRCEEQKDISEFYKNSHASDGLKSICKSCTSKKAKEYYDNNPDKIKELSRKSYLRDKDIISARSKENWKNNESRRKKNRLKPYNITQEELDLLLLNSDYKCNLCGVSREDHYELYKKDLHIDHCHTTQQVRGILCHSCNLGLGYFKDDKNLLSKAITYLK